MPVIKIRVAHNEFTVEKHFDKFWLFSLHPVKWVIISSYIWTWTGGHRHIDTVYKLNQFNLITNYVDWLARQNAEYLNCFRGPFDCCVVDWMWSRREKQKSTCVTETDEKCEIYSRQQMYKRTPIQSRPFVEDFHSAITWIVCVRRRAHLTAL